MQFEEDELKLCQEIIDLYTCGGIRNAFYYAAVDRIAYLKPRVELRKSDKHDQETARCRD